VIPGVADELPGQQFPDHVHRFLEHLQALLRRRPLVTQDVLVKRLAGAHAKAELAAVVTRNDVACEIAPMTDQTRPLSPCSSSYGWK
jgi:hypothetical protein